MSAAIVFILFAVASGNSPDLTALADYPSQQDCLSAASQVKASLNAGDNGRLVVCVSSADLSQLAAKSKPQN